MAAEEHRVRLTQAMEKRRNHLRLQWNDVADRIGISVAHLRRIRNGDGPITSIVAPGIEDALEWRRGSIQAIFDGGDPTPMPPGGKARVASGDAGDSEPTPWVWPDPGDLPSYVDLTSIPPEEAQVLAGLTLLSWEERQKVVIIVRTVLAERERSTGEGGTGADRSRRIG